MQSAVELPPLDVSAPLDRCRDTIIADWVDANRHMNVACYMLVFDKATEVFLQQVGAGRAYTASGIGTVFALEACIKYERELRLNDEVRITTRLVDRDRKLLHLLHSMHHQKSGDRAAAMELLLLHVDPCARRGSSWPAATLDRLEKLFVSHRALASSKDDQLKIRIRRGL
jgi:acyl-CoA thioester hydrolase